MSFEILTTSAGMSVGIIRNRQPEVVNLAMHDSSVRAIVNPGSSVKLMDRVKFTYKGVFSEGEIFEIRDQPEISYKVRVFASSNYSVYDDSNQCVIHPSDVQELLPRDYSS